MQVKNVTPDPLLRVWTLSTIFSVNLKQRQYCLHHVYPAGSFHKRIKFRTTVNAAKEVPYLVLKCTSSWKWWSKRQCLLFTPRISCRCVSQKGVNLGPQTMKQRKFPVTLSSNILVLENDGYGRQSCRCHVSWHPLTKCLGFSKHTWISKGRFFLGKVTRKGYESESRGRNGKVTCRSICLKKVLTRILMCHSLTNNLNFVMYFVTVHY